MWSSPHPTFDQRIAVAWLEAAAFADSRAQLCRTDDTEVRYWEGIADRHELQANLLLGMLMGPPAVTSEVSAG